MRYRARRLIADERGLEITEWVGVSAVTFVLVFAIWGVFLGGAGQTLKQAIGSVAARYANGFEGGLQTSGAGGGQPRICGQAQPSAAECAAPRLSIDANAPSGVLPGGDTTGESVLDGLDMPVLSVPQLASSLSDIDAAPAVAGLVLSLAAATGTAAARQAGSSWWRQALGALGTVLAGVAIGLAALLALAAVIYLGAAALAALGIGAAITAGAALVIAGIVLGVGFVGYSTWQRWQEFAAVHGDPGWGDALKILALGLADLTGIPQLIEGLRGERLLSGLPLDGQARWEQGLGGALQVALFGVGVRVGLPRVLGWLRGRRAVPAPLDRWQ